MPDGEELRVDVVLVRYPVEGFSTPFAVDVLGVYVETELAVRAANGWQAQQPEKDTRYWWNIVAQTVQGFTR